MRNAKRSIAGGLACGVLRPIALERGPVTMKGLAVELDDQALPGPEGVDLVAENVDVGLAGRKLSLTAKEGKTLLEVGSRSDGIARFLDQLSDRTLGPPPSSSRAYVFQRSHFEQPKAVCLFEAAPEPPEIDDFGEVEECAGQARDRNPIPGGHVDGVEQNLPDEDSVTGVATSGAHLDWRSVWP
jgi:hypothetical protein